MKAKEFLNEWIKNVIGIGYITEKKETLLIEFAEAYHESKVQSKSREMYKIIWQTAINLGFKFNETDAHEMALEIKKQLLNKEQ